MYIIWILRFNVLVSPERSVKPQRLTSLRKPVASLELKYAEGNYGLCTSDEWAGKAKTEWKFNQESLSLQMQPHFLLCSSCIMLHPANNNKSGAHFPPPAADYLRWDHSLPFPKETSNWSKHKRCLKHVIAFDSGEIFIQAQECIDR